MNPYIIDIPETNTGKSFVVGDIHGCYNTFKRLIETNIKLTLNDRLFLLGDYVDRGPDSKGVLDYIFRLVQDGFNILPLRGNHEDIYVECTENNEMETLHWLLRSGRSLNLLDENGILQHKYYYFFRSLPYCFRLQNFYLVHGGFDFSKEAPFDDVSSMLWLRHTTPDNRYLEGRYLIHGHEPTNRQTIIETVQNKQQVICLDNGAVFNKPHKAYDHTQLGCLCALDIDSFDLFFQANCETDGQT